MTKSWMSITNGTVRSRDQRTQKMPLDGDDVIQLGMAFIRQEARSPKISFLILITIPEKDCLNIPVFQNDIRGHARQRGSIGRPGGGCIDRCSDFCNTASVSIVT